MDGHAQRTTNRWSMGAAVAILVVAAAVPAANGARPNGRDVTPVPRALHIVIQPQNLVTGALFGVAAASATNAWAVGTTSTDFDARHGAALIEHWNGSTWTQLPSPVGTGSQLSAVTARSANDAWAVGAVANAGFVTKPLILHWNGHAWKRVASPAPGHGSGLGGVTALSAHNAWAVGSFSSGISRRLLVEHWNGRAWRVVKTPRLPKGFIDAGLSSVTATSARDVWAVGSMTPCGCGPGSPVILHYDGRTWKRRTVSGLHDGYSLRSVDAVSARRAFVAGETGDGDGPTHARVTRFNGRHWTPMRTPSPGQHTRHPSDFLSGVAATSAHNAWAVGSTRGNILIERYNGRAWRQVPGTITLPQIAPGIAPGAHTDTLFAVAATSPRNAWAVGTVQRALSSDSLALILHWNGSAWTCCAPLTSAAAAG